MLSVKPLTYSVYTKPSSLINNPVIPDQSLIEYGVILHFSIVYCPSYNIMSTLMQLITIKARYFL